MTTGSLTERRLTVLVAAEDRSTARQLDRLLETMSDVSVIGTAGNETAAVAEVGRLHPDVVIVDAEPSACSGLRIAARLDDDDGPAVILVSALDCYATAAFEVCAIDYLLKPLCHWRLRRAVDRARVRTAEREARRATLRAAGVEREAVIHIPDRNGGRDVRVGDILWVQADRDYALIHSAARSYIVRSTMSELATRLSPTILRVHRSALVSTAYVRCWKSSAKGVPALQLLDGAEVVVGSSYIANVRAALGSLAP